MTALTPDRATADATAALAAVGLEVGITSWVSMDPRVPACREIATQVTARSTDEAYDAPEALLLLPGTVSCLPPARGSRRTVTLWRDAKAVA